jgi:deoxyribonuclease V
MIVQCPHAWEVTAGEARQIQERLQSQVIKRDELGTVRFIAGIDVGFENNGSLTRAAIAVLRFPQLELAEKTIAHRPTCFPYVPGLLSFRETPAVLDALESLKHIPDLLMCDGQGVAHPRRFGLACHIGVVSGIPSIGVAKTRLIGTYDPVPYERGKWKPLLDAGEVIGAVLRTSKGVKPVYVSIGHKISLASAIDYVLRCTPRYRLPETTRMAHRFASGKEMPETHGGD